MIQKRQYIRGAGGNDNLGSLEGIVQGKEEAECHADNDDERRHQIRVTDNGHRAVTEVLKQQRALQENEEPNRLELRRCYVIKRWLHNMT